MRIYRIKDLSDFLRLARDHGTNFKFFTVSGPRLEAEVHMRFKRMEFGCEFSDAIRVKLEADGFIEAEISESFKPKLDSP